MGETYEFSGESLTCILSSRTFKLSYVSIPNQDHGIYVEFFSWLLWKFAFPTLQTLSINSVSQAGECCKSCDLTEQASKIFTGLYWFILVYIGLYWFILVYTGFILVLYRFILVYTGLQYWNMSAVNSLVAKSSEKEVFREYIAELQLTCF